jgi:DNA-binding transcriptional regulator YiaG
MSRRKATADEVASSKEASTRTCPVELSQQVREVVEELNALCDTVEAGVPLEKAATVRTSTINAQPPVLSPAQIRAIRSSLNMSEPLFAMFLGVRLATVRSWEQGRSAPSSLARRFLVAIRDDPGYWEAKLNGAAPLQENGQRNR